MSLSQKEVLRLEKFRRIGVQNLQQKNLDTDRKFAAAIVAANKAKKDVA